MDTDNCSPSRSGQAGGRGTTGEGGEGRDDRKPTGQAGTGQSGARTAGGDPASPRDLDDDPQGGGGRLDQVDTSAAPDRDGDAPSHGSR